MEAAPGAGLRRAAVLLPDDEPFAVRSADLHRLVDAHAELALQNAHSDSRRARLSRGIETIVLSEARRQGWTLPETDVLEVFRHDIDLNAQGLEAWLDSNTRGR